MREHRGRETEKGTLGGSKPPRVTPPRKDLEDMQHPTPRDARPRCHCGVYMDCHTTKSDHAPRKGNRLVLWYRDHSLTYHLLGPVWVRLPEGARWRIVGWLNDHTDRFCWSDLVDAALAYREDDACDLHLPLPSVTCNKACGVLGPGHDEPHVCSCYCGQRTFMSEGRAAA